MSMFTLAISCLTTSNIPWFMEHSRFLCSIALYSIKLYFHHQSHHSWVLFLLWLHLFILSGVISPLFSSNILGTYQPGEFIFQCHTFLPFYTVYGVLKARILKWFAFAFSVDHVLSELSTMTRPSWVALHGMTHTVRQSCGPWDQLDCFSVIVVFTVSALWWTRIKGLRKLPDGRDYSNLI